MPDGLTTFIAERLNEAEQNISHAGPARIARLTYLRDDGQLAYTTVAAGDDNSPWCADGRELPEPASVRVVWDPARELRAITAKRAILADCTAKLRYPANAPLYNLAVRTLRSLGTEWADHPAYLPEWSPEPAGHDALKRSVATLEAQVALLMRTAQASGDVSINAARGTLGLPAFPEDP